MKITEFINEILLLGYDYELTNRSIKVYRLYGKDLSKRMRIATIYLTASYHFEMSLDPSSANDGVGELISKLGMSSLRTRGRQWKYSIRDGNYYEHKH